MLVLDTDSVATGERADAFQEAVSRNCSTSAAAFADPGAVQAKVHMYDFGPSKVLNIDASAPPCVGHHGWRGR